MLRQEYEYHLKNNSQIRYFLPSIFYADISYLYIPIFVHVTGGSLVIEEEKINIIGVSTSLHFVQYYDKIIEVKFGHDTHPLQSSRTCKGLKIAKESSFLVFCILF